MATTSKPSETKDDGLKTMYKAGGRSIKCNPSPRSIKAMMADGWTLTKGEADKETK